MDIESYQNGDVVFVNHPRRGFVSGVIFDQGPKKEERYVYGVCSVDWPDSGWGLWVSQKDLDIWNN